MESNKEQNSIIYLLAYIIPLLTGIIVYIIYGDKNKRFKFHGLQAILLGAVIIVLDVIFGLIGIFLVPKFPIVGIIFDIIVAIIWLYGIYVGFKASTGTDINMPVIGNYAKSMVN